MRKDCPYCEGTQKFFIANTNIEIACDYCVKGFIPKPGETKIGLIERIKNFFGNNDASDT